MDELALVEGNLVVSFGHLLVGELPGPDSPDDLELLIGNLDVLLIKLVLDGSPPVWVFAFFDELIEAIVWGNLILLLLTFLATALPRTS
jgi:hypothetical protein